MTLEVPNAAAMSEAPGSATGDGCSTEPALSFVVPVLNDAACLVRLLNAVADLDTDHKIEVIVVDGGSVDPTVAVAQQLGATVITSPAGRGGQLARGTSRARGRWVWMLHADSLPAARAVDAIVGLTGPGWGWCDLMFDTPGMRYRVLAWFMNNRSALTGVSTGDQGIFVARGLLAAVGGVPDQPLMEDIELCRRLRRRSRAIRLRHPVTTSARRWQMRGFVRTVLEMWIYRAAYFFGASPISLARRYYQGNRFE